MEQGGKTTEENCRCECEACNLGLLHGPKSVSPRTYFVILFLLVQVEHERFRQESLNLGDA